MRSLPVPLPASNGSAVITWEPEKWAEYPWA
jgi:hypothetical protein